MKANGKMAKSMAKVIKMYLINNLLILPLFDDTKGKLFLNN